MARAYQPNNACTVCAGWMCTVEYPHPTPALLATGRFIAVDPASGAKLRNATSAEVGAYLLQPTRFNDVSFRKAVRVGDVLVDEWTGPGGSHTPGRFLK